MEVWNRSQFEMEVINIFEFVIGPRPRREIY